MTKTAQDIIAGVEVLTIVTECYGGGGPGGTDKRGETKMTVGHLEQCRFSPRDWLPVRIDSYFRV